MGNYNWTYAYVGGVPRVRITSGADIAHLGELDQKQWTVLSCPVKGLEIDEKSLNYMDTDQDGSIHVSEVIATANWLNGVLKNMDVLLKSSDTLALADLNTETEDGKLLHQAAQEILTQLGKADATEISLADSTSCLASFLKNKLEVAQAEAAKIAAVEAPYGADTDSVDANYQALDAKVRDFFMRSKLASFAQESTAALDVQVSRIEAISSNNLLDKTAEIASYPIARISDKAEIDLSAGINPAWSAQVEALKATALKDVTVLTEAAWAEIGAKLQAYKNYLASSTVSEADIVLDDATTHIQRVDKLLHLTRDFYTLLNNFVTLVDFYDLSKLSIFQAGTLYINQRSCDLCVKVSDTGAMAAGAASSGLYLVCCDCLNRKNGASMKIVAAITVGDADNISVGQNCIFYDRQGTDWEAKVTSIVDNPISLGQAWWAPYKKFAKFVEEQIAKFAASKDGAMNDMTSNLENKIQDAQKPAEAPAEGEEVPQPSIANSKEAGKAAASGFDIAKFCGIFAAIGMALGYIGSFCMAVVTGFISLKWWQMPLSIIALMLVISGPAVFIAWMKLRKRNLAPVLNANGWAINAGAKINVRFGKTMTQLANFPHSASLKKADPFAEKGMSLGAKLLWTLIVLVLILVALYFLGVINVNANYMVSFS